MKLTRRRLIFGVLGATALLPVGYVVRVSLGGYQYSKKYSHLSVKESAIVASLADAVIGKENIFEISPESVDTVGAVNNFIASGSKLEQNEIHILLWAVEHVFPIFGGNFKKFTQLSVEQQISILTNLGQSKRELPKLLARATKTVISFGYFNTPQLQESLGLRGWCGQ